MQDFITGIQQIGIGVDDAREAMILYKDLFGMDILIFDDVAEATLMTQYTGGEKHRRRAVLSLNMAGGGGYEIWQFLDRKPTASPSPLQYGDLGIYAAKIKCTDVLHAHQVFSVQEGLLVTALKICPKGSSSFFVTDKYGNNFQIVTDNTWFKKNNKVVGGVLGAVIGVSDMERALSFYKDVLGIDCIIYDVTGGFDDVPGVCGRKYRRVALRKQPSGKGAFNKLLGAIEIELVQCLDREACRIYKDRYWGDKGFIHLCFDVLDMDALKAHAHAHGFGFTVDSQNSFAMENAAGRFCYAEDPDGTLIELVETHKVPIMKKYGLYLNLEKRGLTKELPDWMVKMLALSKVK